MDGLNINFYFKFKDRFRIRRLMYGTGNCQFFFILNMFELLSVAQESRLVVTNSICQLSLFNFNTREFLMTEELLFLEQCVRSSGRGGQS